MVSVASCVRRCSFHLLNVFLATVLIMFAVYHTTDTRSSALDYQPTREIIVGSVSKIRDDSVMERLVDDTANESRVEVSANESRVEVSVSGGRVDSVLSGCDLFSGKWVYDNKSYPLYKDRECRFMFDDLACEKYGRKDLDYQRWRWQPHACDLPRSLSLSHMHVYIFANRGRDNVAQINNLGLLLACVFYDSGC